MSAALALLLGAWLAAASAPESAPAPDSAPAPASAPAPDSAAYIASLTAKPPPDHGPRWAASLQLASLRATGVSLLFERMLFPPRWSVAAGLGLRYAGERDYAWLGVNLALEGRFYFLGKGLLRHARDGGMIGPFVGVRLDAAWGRLRDRVDRETADSNVTISPLALGGYRFSWWGKVETTLYGGLGFRTDVDPTGRLATDSGWAALWGFTVGAFIP